MERRDAYSRDRPVTEIAQFFLGKTETTSIVDAQQIPRRLRHTNLQSISQMDKRHSYLRRSGGAGRSRDECLQAGMTKLRSKRIIVKWSSRALKCAVI